MRKRRYLPLLFLLALFLLIGFTLWWAWPSAPLPPAPRPPITPIYTLPSGTQLLTYPFPQGLTTAGYQNARYEQKNGYPHYGADFIRWTGGRAEVGAAGAGEVLGVEQCDNSIGGVVVMRFDAVYLPAEKQTVSLIGRYYHMTALAVKTGDHVTAGQTIGWIDSADKWYNHVHFELDTDLDYPFHTPQVAKSSSELLVRFPADGKSLLDPAQVLAVPKGGVHEAHPNSECVTEKDTPAYYEEQFAPER